MACAVVQQESRRDVVDAVDVADVDVGMPVAIDVPGAGGVAVVRRLRQGRRCVNELPGRCGKHERVLETGVWITVVARIGYEHVRPSIAVAISDYNLSRGSGHG